MTVIGLRRRTSSAAAGSVIKAAGSVTADASSLLAAAARLCAVPPEIMSEGRGRPGGAATLASRSASARSSPQRSRAASAASSTARSAGNDSKPQTCTSLTPACAARLVEGVDHLAHEGDLPGQVGVVGATGHAGFDHRPPVQRVGADEVEHHPRARSHRRQGLRVVEVGDDRLRRADALLAEDSIELCGVARRRRPLRAGLRRPLGEVRGDPATGDPGRPEDDDVEVSLGDAADDTSSRGTRRST